MLLKWRLKETAVVIMALLLMEEIGIHPIEIPELATSRAEEQDLS